jgi:hypothetical protein
VCSLIHPDRVPHNLSDIEKMNNAKAAQWMNGAWAALAAAEERLFK